MGDGDSSVAFNNYYKFYLGGKDFLFCCDTKLLLGFGNCTTSLSLPDELSSLADCSTMIFFFFFGLAFFLTMITLSSLSSSLSSSMIVGVFLFALLFALRLF